jgi:hypothetical protein
LIIQIQMYNAYNNTDCWKYSCSVRALWPRMEIETRMQNLTDLAGASAICWESTDLHTDAAANCGDAVALDGVCRLGSSV